MGDGLVRFSAYRWIVLGACPVTLALLAGCFGQAEVLFNQTASLGGGAVGARGDVQVLVINNTPFKAAFVTGTYDQTDLDSTPAFQAFGLDPADTNLDGNEDNLSTQQCARVFSVGSAGLLAAIDANGGLDALPADAREVGVRFFSENTVDGETELVEEGFAPSLERLLGTDFNCNALLICYLEFDDLATDRFRIEFSVMPAESTR